MVMSEWSDDDRVPVAPSLSTVMPPHSTRTEEQPKVGEGVLEQRAKGILEPQAREILERQAEERQTVETTGPPPQGTQVDPRAMPRGSGRQRRFRKLYR